MQIKAQNPEEYIAKCPEDRQAALHELRKTILDALPKGFEEQMNYGMIGYVVPKSIYPAGYHCDTTLPLPFMSFASQKNFIALYHSGIYAKEELLQWFLSEWPKHSKKKLDMGKNCIRFKKVEDIPFDLISTLCKKMSVEEFVDIYESRIKS
ncbi:MAG: DUF1801 domain-containing protein [Luteibaculum sp.]